ncbi:centromere protein H (CENP-H)-domain-containing protein [Trichoderma asperelloides]|nr:centromere protein H (CENP-H)-domain-containing protein [Trichoderma asperelloides]
MSEVDEPMTGVDGGESRLPLSEDETRVLELYDKLQELRLEIAILNAQQAGRNYDESNITEAQDALLTARARYRLRNDAIESVMMANPILKAVHNGTQASPIERDLFPYVQERDETSISVAQHAESVAKLRDDLTKVQVQSLRVCRENMELTSELFALAEQAKQKKAVRVDDPRVQQEMEKLTREVKTSRQRWRVMKGVASGVVAGSGVDWAKDEDLRNIVLDPEDED